MSAGFPVRVEFSAVDKLTAEVQRINQKIKETSAPSANLSKKFTDLGNALNLPGVRDAFGNVSDAAGKLKSEIMGAAQTAFVFGAAVVGSGFGIVKTYSDAASKILDTSKKLGVGVEALQELRFAAKQSGVEQEAFDKGLQKLAQNSALAAAGTGDSVKVFKALGISLKDSSGKLRNVESLLPELADKFKNIESESLRAALASKIFGKEGANIGLLLAEGSTGIQKLRTEAKSLGLVLGEQSVASAEEFGDTLEKVQDTFGAVRNIIAAELLPVFAQLSQEFLNFVKENRSQIQAFGQTFKIVLEQVLSIGMSVFGALGRAVSFFTSLPAWAQMAAINALMIAFATIAGVKIVLAIGGLIGALAGLWPVLANLGVVLAQLVPVIGSMLWGALTSILGLVPGLIAGIGSVVTSLGGMAVALLANPIFWIPAAIIAVGSAIYLLIKYWDEVTSFFRQNFDIYDLFLSLTGPIGWIIMAGRKVIEHWQPVKEFFSNLIPEGVRQFFGGGAATVSGGPTAGAQGAITAIQQSQQASISQASVKVDFTNLPRGSQVSTGSNNDANLDLGLGYAGVF